MFRHSARPRTRWKRKCARATPGLDWELVAAFAGPNLRWLPKVCRRTRPDHGSYPVAADADRAPGRTVFCAGRHPPIGRRVPYGANADAAEVPSCSDETRDLARKVQRRGVIRRRMLGRASGPGEMPGRGPTSGRNAEGGVRRLRRCRLGMISSARPKTDRPDDSLPAGGGNRGGRVARGGCGFDLRLRRQAGGLYWRDLLTELSHFAGVPRPRAQRRADRNIPPSKASVSNLCVAFAGNVRSGRSRHSRRNSARPRRPEHISDPADDPVKEISHPGAAALDDLFRTGSKQGHAERPAICRFLASPAFRAPDIQGALHMVSGELNRRASGRDE